MARFPGRFSSTALRALARACALFAVLLAIAAPALAGSLTLAWDPVISPLVAGYVIHYGPGPGNYTASIDAGNVTTRTLSGLSEGATYHFVVAAYDAAHTEGGLSNDVGTVVAYTVPVANFSASTVSGPAPLVLNFINSSTGVITSYAWTFGDGTTSTAANPAKAYSTPGSYTVGLTVTGPGGSNLMTRPNYITVAAATTSAAPVWVDDAVPAGAAVGGDGEGWSWVSGNPAPYSGALAHQSALLSGVHQHYFYNATTTLSVAAGDTLFAYVYLDPANPPREVMLQWNDGSWEHRAYWGANLIGWGTDGTVSRRYMGPLPAAGQWVRLAVPASAVGLDGRTVNGMAYTLYDGRATWDYAGKVSATTVWADDAVPAGATLAGMGEGWSWVSGNPAPYSGALAHQSALLNGLHQHDFYNATTTLSVAVGDTLFAYVYLDPANPPREVMLQWNDGSWEHRAYWGANLIAWGTDGTVSRRYMGPLPAAGQWVRLAVPASAVGLEGRTLNGMAYTLYDGRATWDYAGKVSATTVWADDAVPAGATLAGMGEGWSWVSGNPAPYAGALAHQSALLSGVHQHYFYNATTTLSVAAGDTLFAYVYLDPANPPREVMLQWNDGSWEHRAYWGANLIGWGTDGTVSRRYMGPLPAAGQWVRLAVPASAVGLEGRTLNGMAYTLYDGRATWDYAGKVSATTVWADDAVPAGATLAGMGEGWSWVSGNPAPYAGALAHQSALLSGVHQHHFYNATTTLSVAAGDTLFAYVYLDPANPPREVMLQWNDGSWEHRAYWGANLIGWGTDGTVSRRYMGPLPAAGQWVRLAVPASEVGLEGRTLNGMAYTLYDGRATWDYAGSTN